MKLNSNKRKNIGEEKLLINDATPFSIKESFNLLRTNIIYTSSDSEGAPVYGMASTGSASGKSTIIANLAISLANTSKRVLLIDADMRCPMQNKIFKYKKDAHGLSEYLSGVIKDRNEGIIKTDYENLSIMPSGFIPPNPTELLMGNRFKELVAALKLEYDYLLIDFPPIGVVADSAAAVDCVDGYIFVARAGQSRISDVKQTIGRLESLGGKVVGIVLNDADMKSGGYGKYGKYGKYGSSGN